MRLYHALVVVLFAGEKLGKRYEILKINQHHFVKRIGAAWHAQLASSKPRCYDGTVLGALAEGIASMNIVNLKNA